MTDLTNKRLGNSTSTSMCGWKYYVAANAAKIPVDANLETETKSINGSDRCEVRFEATKDRGVP